MQRKLYPAEWEAIAAGVKWRAEWCCELCQRPCIKPGEDFYGFLSRIQGTKWADTLPDEEEVIDFTAKEIKSLKTQFVLTVAHLNHIPSDCTSENLKALCAPCHCRYDNHPTQRAIKRRLKQERLGQLSLELE